MHRLLVISDSPFLNSFYGLLLRNIYTLEILQKYFTIEQVCYGLEEDTVFKGIKLYKEGINIDECLILLEKLLIISKPHIILLLQETQFFKKYYYVLNIWQGSICGWFDLKSESHTFIHILHRVNSILQLNPRILNDSLQITFNLKEFLIKNISNNFTFNYIEPSIICNL